MSLRCPPEDLAHLCHHARLFTDRASDQEGRLEAFVAAADGDLRHAEAAVSRAADDLDVDEVRHLLAAQLDRCAAGAAAARASLRVRSNSMPLRVSCWRIWIAMPAWPPGARMRCSSWMTTVPCVTCWRAANGLEALIAAYEMRPGVIVMDVSMPVLDGIEATRLIKAGEATRDARVIAYTGTLSFDDSPTRTLFAAVLQKPATPAAVLATVQRVAALWCPRAFA